MSNETNNPQDGEDADRAQRLSYKFQRLRERLRDAVTTGELKGKLPGERQLAKKFRVNAKTLSKALTDLAAEGLLERSIGRGTYVRDAASAAPASNDGRWLVLVDDVTTPHWLLAPLARFNSAIEAVSSKEKLRPSELAGVRGVIDAARETSDDLIRDLLVRNIPTVIALRQQNAYSTHTVSIDRQLGAASLAREMVLLGHRHFFVAESRNSVVSVHDIVRQIVGRYDSTAVVDHGFATDAVAAVRQGATAVICTCTGVAGDSTANLLQAKITVPGQVSVGCAGAAGPDVPCSGYYVDRDRFADTIAGVLRDHGASRPVNLWLAGSYREKNTIAAPSLAQVPLQQPSGSMGIAAMPPNRQA